MGGVATSLSMRADHWLLLIHHLPAKPAYLRVKVWRRLRALGAVAVKNAVYALPANEQTQEDFEWLLKEITEGGGEAMICEAQLIDGGPVAVHGRSRRGLRGDRQGGKGSGRSSTSEPERHDPG